MFSVYVFRVGIPISGRSLRFYYGYSSYSLLAGLQFPVRSRLPMEWGPHSFLFLRGHYAGSGVLQLRNAAILGVVSRHQGNRHAIVVCLTMACSTIGFVRFLGLFCFLFPGVPTGLGLYVHYRFKVFFFHRCLFWLLLSFIEGRHVHYVRGTRVQVGRTPPIVSLYASRFCPRYLVVSHEGYRVAMDPIEGMANYRDRVRALVFSYHHGYLFSSYAGLVYVYAYPLRDLLGALFLFQFF